MIITYEEQQLKDKQMIREYLKKNKITEVKDYGNTDGYTGCKMYGKG